MAPTRKIAYHTFPGFLIVKVECDKGYLFKFPMKGDDDISFGAYYRRGSMVITDAADPSIMGTVFTGFFDFSQHPKLNTLNSWMDCLVEDDMEWYCVHSAPWSVVNGETVKSISFASTNLGLTVDPNTDVLVVEGTLSDGQGELYHIPHREMAFTLYGDAKVFLLHRT